MTPRERRDLEKRVIASMEKAGRIPEHVIIKVVPDEWLQELLDYWSSTMYVH